MHYAMSNRPSWITDDGRLNVIIQPYDDSAGWFRVMVDTSQATDEEIAYNTDFINSFDKEHAKLRLLPDDSNASIHDARFTFCLMATHGTALQSCHGYIQSCGDDEIMKLNDGMDMPYASSIPFPNVAPMLSALNMNNGDVRRGALEQYMHRSTLHPTGFAVADYDMCVVNNQLCAELEDAKTRIRSSSLVYAKDSTKEQQVQTLSQRVAERKTMSNALLDRMGQIYEKTRISFDDSQSQTDEEFGS